MEKPSLGGLYYTTIHKQLQRCASFVFLYRTDLEQPVRADYIVATELTDWIQTNPIYTTWVIFTLIAFINQLLVYERIFDWWQDVT